MQREGTVKLMRGGRADPSMARYPSSFSRHPSPHPIRRTPASEASGGAPTAVDVARPGRDSARVAVDREKPLRGRGGCEPAHLSLALSRRLMRTRCAVVRILPRAVNHGWHHGAVRRGVAGGRSLSVTSRRGDRPCPCNTLRKNRAAARRSRRDCTKMSRTSPSWSTARHRYWRRPWNVTKTSSRYQVSPSRPRRRRNFRASSRPNV